MTEPLLSTRARSLAAVGQASSWAIADEGLRRVAAGEDILLLTLGDPVCPPHPAIVAATKAGLDAGRTHYTPLHGEPALRAAIARIAHPRFTAFNEKAFTEGINACQDSHSAARRASTVTLP